MLSQDWGSSLKNLVPGGIGHLLVFQAPGMCVDSEPLPLLPRGAGFPNHNSQQQDTGTPQSEGPNGHPPWPIQVSPTLLTLAFSSWASAWRSASFLKASRSSSRDTSESDGRLV